MKPVHIIMLVLLCIVWGVTFSVLKLAVVFVPPVIFSALRFLIAGLLSLAVLIAMKKKLPARSSMPHIIKIGILQTALTVGLVTVSVKYTEAGATSIYLYTYPMFVSVIGGLLLPAEKLLRSDLYALGLGLAGIIFVAMEKANPFAAGTSGITGVILVTLASITWSLATIILKKHLASEDKFTVNTFQMLFGSAFLFLLVPVFEAGASPVWNNLSILYLAFAAILGSAAGFSIWFYLLDHIKLSGTAFLFLVPAFGVISGKIIFGESLGLLSWAGLLFVSVSIYLTGAGAKAKQRMENETADNTACFLDSVQVKRI